MKKQDFINKLSELTKIEVKDLTEAITSESEDVDIEFQELSIFTREELEQRDINLGKKAGNTGIEIAVKNARNEYELEFEGKTIPNLVKAAIEKGKQEANVKPNEKIKELESQTEKLRENILTIEKERDEYKNQTVSIKNDYNMTTTIAGLIPKDVEMPWNAKELNLIYKNNREITTDEDGKQIIKINGEVQRNPKTAEPITVEEDMKTWIEEKTKGMVSVKRGRGEGDRNPRSGGNIEIKGIQTTADFNKYCEENEIKNFDDKAQLLKEIKKENKEFILE